MSEDIAIIILAAGKGQRMKSPLPKVLHKVAGKPLISYVVDSISSLSPKEVTLVIGEDMEDVKKESSGVLPINFVVQKDRLGTADAVKQAVIGGPNLKDFNGTVIVLYGDHPFIKTETLLDMKRKLVDESLAVAVLGFVPDNPANYGRLVVNSGELEEIVEYKDANEEQRAIGLCNSGVMAIKGRLLFELLNEVRDNNVKNEYYLTDIIAIANGKGHKCGVVKREEREVMGINSQKEKTLAESNAQEGLRNKALDNGVNIIAPETVFLCDDTEIGEGTIIHPYVVFGSNVKIGKGAEIKSFSHIEGADIASNATIGPYARIRPGTKIEEGAGIGNFVEVKNSVIKKGVKANHLSYIGDSDVGEGSNIGAGVITCNYDGYNKHKTKIGKNVFVGSNSSLVAPLKVGDGAIIGAGSTVTKDVANNSMTVSENNQKNMEGKADIYRKEKEVGNG